ncbi:MAG: hypothetical protein U0174_09440 [Polyangiaceae bacterium]
MKNMYGACVATLLWASSALADEPEPLPAPAAAAAPASPANSEAKEPLPPPAPPPAPPAVAPPEPLLKGPIGDQPLAVAHRAPSRYRLSGTIRASAIGDDAVDVVAKGASMPAAGIEGTGVFYRRGSFSLAVGAAWAAGGRQGDVRGVKTRSFLHHLLVPLEGRFALVPWLDLRGRVSPGASYLTVDFGDGADTTTANGWAFSTELAAGTSVRLLGDRKGGSTLEMWGLVDGGYLLSTAVSLDASRRPPEEQLGTQAPTSFGSIAPRGAFLRFGLAMAF